MDRLKRSLEEEFVSFSSKIPANDGTVFGYSQRLKKVLDLKDEFVALVNKKANDFVEKN